MSWRTKPFQTPMTINVGIVGENQDSVHQISDHLPQESLGQIVPLSNLIDAPTFWATVAQNAHDVIILHLSKEGVVDFHRIKQLFDGQSDRCPLLIVADDVDAVYQARLLRIGVQGCLLTDGVSTELAPALEAVSQGRRFVCRQIRDALAYLYIEELCEGNSSNHSV